MESVVSENNKYEQHKNFGKLEENPLKEKTRKQYDRTSLEPHSIEILESLVKQAQDEISELPPLSLKDMVNFLIEVRSHSLTEEELKQLYAKYFDPIKIMKLATQDMIAAKARGEHLAMDDALKKYQTPSISNKSISRKTKGRPKKQDGSPEASGEFSLNDEDINKKKSLNKVVSKDTAIETENSRFPSENTVNLEIENV